MVSALSLSLVAGCAEDSKDAEVAAHEPAPAEVEEAPEVELLTYEDIVISEKGPTVAELGSAEGAKEAVQLYLAALTAGFQSKDSSVIEAMSDADCDSCKLHISNMKNMAALGCEVPADVGSTFGEALAYPLGGQAGAYGVLAHVDVMSWPDEEYLAGRECRTFSETNKPLAFIVRPVESGWIMWGFDQLDETEFQKLWADVEAVE